MAEMKVESFSPIWWAYSQVFYGYFFSVAYRVSDVTLSQGYAFQNAVYQSTCAKDLIRFNRLLGMKTDLFQQPNQLRSFLTR